LVDERQRAKEADEERLANRIINPLRQQMEEE